MRDSDGFGFHLCKCNIESCKFRIVVFSVVSIHKLRYNSQQITHEMQDQQERMMNLQDTYLPKVSSRKFVHFILKLSFKNNHFDDLIHYRKHIKHYRMY